MRPKISYLLAVLLWHVVSVHVNGFVSLCPAPTRSLATSSNSNALYGHKSFLTQKEGESDIEFFKRIQKTASDPAAFEKMVLGKDKEEKSKYVAPGADDDSDSDSGDGETQPKKKNNGYRRVEEWDAEVKARQKKGEFTWEERVQFEGQRHGNQANQNEILRKNLKGF